MNEPQTTLESLIGRARAEINSARSHLEAETAVDLSRLMALVQEISTLVSSVPKQDATPFRHRMLALFDELEKLDDAVTRAHAEAAGKLRGLSGGARTVSAYRNAISKD